MRLRWICSLSPKFLQVWGTFLTLTNSRTTLWRGATFGTTVSLFTGEVTADHALTSYTHVHMHPTTYFGIRSHFHTLKSKVSYTSNLRSHKLVEQDRIHQELKVSYISIFIRRNTCNVTCSRLHVKKYKMVQTRLFHVVKKTNLLHYLN